MRKRVTEKLCSGKLGVAIVAMAMACAAGEVQYAAHAAVAYMIAEAAVDIARLIADAIRASYDIPSIAEIVAEMDAAEDENNGRPAEEGAGERE